MINICCYALYVFGIFLKLISDNSALSIKTKKPSEIVYRFNGDSYTSARPIYQLSLVDEIDLLHFEYRCIDLPTLRPLDQIYEYFQAGHIESYAGSK